MADYKVIEDYVPSEEDLAYRKMLSTARPNFIPPPKTTVQAPSTQRILDAHARGETLVQFKEPLPDYHVRDENGEIFINERPVTVQEFTTYQSMRNAAKNQLGESKKTAFGEDRKEQARQSYVCTPPAELTEVEKERLTRMNKITELTSMPPIKKKKFMDWLKTFFKKQGALQERHSYAELQQLWKKEEKK